MARRNVTASPVSVEDDDGNPLPHVQVGNTVRVIQPPEAGDNSGEILDDEQFVDPFSRAAAELGESGEYGRVEIYRIRRTLNGVVEAFVAPMSLEEFNYVEVQRRYGGGEFRFKLKNEKGQIKKVGTQMFEGEPITHRTPQVTQQPTPPHLASYPYQSPPQQDATLPLALGELMKQNNAILQTLAQQQQMFGAMLQNLGRQKSTIEIAQEFAAIKGLFGGGGMDLDNLSKMVSIVKDIGGDGGGGGKTSEMDLFGKMIDQFGPAIIGGMQKDSMPNPSLPHMPLQPQPMPIPNPSSPNFPPSPPYPSQPSTQKPDPEIMKLKMALSFLCSKAKENSDPALYADLVLDNAADDEIRALFANSNWLDQLATVHPPVREHAAWFTSLKTAIENILTEPEDVGNPQAEPIPDE